MIVDSWVIDIMYSTSQDGGKDLKISKDRLRTKWKMVNGNCVKISKAIIMVPSLILALAYCHILNIFHRLKRTSRTFVLESFEFPSSSLDCSKYSVSSTNSKLLNALHRLSFSQSMSYQLFLGLHFLIFFLHFLWACESHWVINRLTITLGPSPSIQ